MTRDEIYEHLAKVYLGKRDNVEQKKKKQLNAWIVMNIVITILILASTFYGFTAFLTRRSSDFKNKIIYSLNNSPIRISYNLNLPYPPHKTFSLSVPAMDVSKYDKINISIRGMDEGYPGIIKMILTNAKNEKSSYYLKHVDYKWQQVAVPFEKFDLTDWSNLTDVAFVLEAWNVDHKKGTVLIDDISFSN